MKSCVDDEKYTAGRGAIAGLHAVGPQERWLYNDALRFNDTPPKHSHFTKVYRRQDKLNTSGSRSWPFASTQRFFLNPYTSGDIITNAYIKLTLPKLATGERYTSMVGNQLIKNVTLKVDGVTIDKFDIDKWSVIHNELFNSSTEKFGLSYMLNNGLNGIDNTWANDDDTDVIKIFVNLYLFFGRRRTNVDQPSDMVPGLYLCALYNTKDIYIDVEFNPQSWFSNSTGDIALSTNTLEKDKRLQLITEEIILTPREREYYMHADMKLIYDSLYFTLDAGFTDVKTHVTNLFSKYPVQSMHWFYRRAKWGSENTSEAVANRTNYSTDESVSNAATHAASSSVVIDQNPIYLNGVSIADKQTHQYFKYIQPYTYNMSIPRRNIYTNSFAIRPTIFMPTGSINIGKQMNKSTLRGILRDDGFELFIFYLYFNFMHYKDGRLTIT